MAEDTTRTYVPTQKTQDKATAHLDEPQSWRWVKTLYDTNSNETHTKRGQVRTIVSLYVKIDANSDIIDRVVIKRVLCRSKESATRLEAEALRMKALSFSGSIVKLRGIGSFVDGRQLWVYTEFCPSRDLQTLLDLYHPSGNAIPEPFIWSMFFTLAEAIFAMSTGKSARECEDNNEDLEYNQHPEPDWNTMIHTDIKPQNIFLSNPEEPYLDYPKPLLGDFDISIQIPADADEAYFTDQKARCPGTMTWKSPEMLEPELPHKLSEKLDIWGAGLIIWMMMNAELGDEELFKQREQAVFLFKFSKGDTFPRRHVGVTAQYSDALHSLVQKCLRLDPDERPSVVVLRRTIREALDNVESMTGIFRTCEPDMYPLHVELDYVRDENFVVGDKAVLPALRVVEKKKTTARGKV